MTGRKPECDSQPAWAVDLGELPSGNRSASCIDFYFHGWLIWVSALESQLGCHQGQLGRQGICFCLHQFHTVSRYGCVVRISISVHLLLHPLFTAFIWFVLKGNTCTINLLYLPKLVRFESWCVFSKSLCTHVSHIQKCV